MMETPRVYCLGCGGDLMSMPRERRNLGAESKAASKPCAVLVDSAFEW